MSFTRQNLFFRSVEPADLEMLMQHRNANLAGLRTPIPVMGMSEQTMWYDSLHKENLALIAMDAADAVGMLRISNIEWPQRSAGLTGTDVFAPHQGKGFGTCILRAGAEWLIQDLGMHRVTAECLAHNAAAAHIIDKAGFKLEGRKRQYLWRDGKWHDFFQYSILEGEL